MPKCNRGTRSSVVQKRFVEDFADTTNAEGVLRPDRHWRETKLINVRSRAKFFVLLKVNKLYLYGQKLLSSNVEILLFSSCWRHLLGLFPGGITKANPHHHLFFWLEITVNYIGNSKFKYFQIITTDTVFDF